MSRCLTSLGVVAALAASGVVVGAQFVSSAGESDESIFVSITPCRLVDTRPDTPANPDINVGPRDTKVGEDEAATFTAWGTGDADSDCDIPNSATAIATNTVAIAPSARSFMTLYPADVDNPGTANLNYVAGQAPTPNSANVPLSAIGTFNVYNAFGDVHVVIDINGYYQPSSNVGPTGPQGDPGAAGADGEDGAAGTDAENGRPNRISDQQIAELAWHEDPADVAEVSIGPGPRNFASDGTNLFVTNAADGVIVVDPATNASVDADPTLSGKSPISLPLGADPVGIAFAGGMLYTANTGGDSVSVIDPATLTVDGPPIALAVDSEPFNIAGGDTQVVVTLRLDNEIAVIDTTTLAVETVAVGDAPNDVVIVGDDAWVSHSDGDVHIVDLTDLSATPEVIVLTTVGDLRGMASTGSHVWVLSGDSGSGDGGIFKVEVETREIVDLDAGPPEALLFSTDTRRVAYDGRWLYVADVASFGVTIIDPTINFVVGTAQANFPDQDVYFDGTSVWAARSPSNNIVRLLPR